MAIRRLGEYGFQRGLRRVAATARLDGRWDMQRGIVAKYTFYFASGTVWWYSFFFGVKAYCKYICLCLEKEAVNFGVGVGASCVWIRET